MRKYFEIFLKPKKILENIKDKNIRDIIYNILVFMVIYVISLYFYYSLDFVSLRFFIYFIILYPFFFLFNNFVYFSFSKIFKNNLNFLKQLSLSSYIEIPLAILFAILFYFSNILIVPIALSIYRIYLQTAAIEVAHGLERKKALLVVLLPGLIYLLLYIR